MKPQHLTYEKVLKANRKAYKKGKLAFQAPLNIHKGEALYEYPNDPTVHCAIGCALSKSTIKRINEEDMVDEFITYVLSRKLISVPLYEADKFIRLQEAHDNILLSNVLLSNVFKGDYLKLISENGKYDLTS